MASVPSMKGLRVLELGEYISSPYCGKLLAQFGAQVIKVEPPHGDRARRHGPFANATADPEASGLFLYLNSNKLGVTLDLASEAGRALLLELIRHADILVENCPPALMREWRLTHEDVRRVNPALIMTSVTVFGQTGPHSGLRGYALTASAASSASYYMGDPQRQPLNMVYDRADYYGGIAAASGTTLALLARESTGQGQHVDIATAHWIDTLVTCLEDLDYVDTGSYPRRPGRRRQSPGGYPWLLLPCKDGYFALINATERHWDRFIELMGRPAWAHDPRFQDRRVIAAEHADEVDALIKPWLAQYTKRELWQKFRAAGIPWHPVQTVKDLLEWEQLQWRRYWQPVGGEGAEPWRVPGAPFRMSETPAEAPRRAPRLGEHNQQVFGDILGLSPGALDSLEAVRVI